MTIENDQISYVKHALTPLYVFSCVTSVMDPNLRGLETSIVRAPWAATRLSRAKEIVFWVLSKCHCVFPVMHNRYERRLWVVRVAR